MNHGRNGKNGRNGDEIQIEEEPSFEVKEEPTEEEVPTRRFMARAVDLDDGSDGNRSVAKSLSKLQSRKKPMGKTDKLHNKNPSCSKDVLVY